MEKKEKSDWTREGSISKSPQEIKAVLKRYQVPVSEDTVYLHGNLLRCIAFRIPDRWDLSALQQLIDDLRSSKYEPLSNFAVHSTNSDISPDIIAVLERFDDFFDPSRKRFA